MTGILSTLIGKLSIPWDDPYRMAREWQRATGRKALGCAPMQFPEELAHAAGMLPVVIQASAQPPTRDQQYMYSFYCGIVRGFVDGTLKGDYDFFDAVALPYTCLQMLPLARLLDRRLGGRRCGFIQMPLMIGKTGLTDYTVQELRATQRFLEDVSGEEITNARLAQSIALYNENRALLRQMYAVRRRNPAALRARDFLQVVRASMLMPKDVHSEVVSDLLSNLEGAKAGQGDVVRLVLSGALCAAPPLELLDLIEELGGAICDDDIYAGYKYFAADVATGDDPIESLAERHLNTVVPCPTRTDPRIHWGQWLTEMTRCGNAEGVVICMFKFCEPHMFYYPHVKEALSTANIPSLLLEIEPASTPWEGVRTRLQAFLELLRARREE